jgi:nitrous oxidase accessory protein NosD
VDDGSYYNGIHFSEHVELPTAPLFERNRISYTGNHGNGINSQNADNAQLIGNDVSHFNHHGLDAKNSSGVVFSGNVVHDSVDSNGIYEEYCANGVVENNVIYNLTGATTPGRGSGIQIDVGTSGARILHNSIFNVFTGIYLVSAATLQFNAVANAQHSVLDAKAGGVFDHNIWGATPAFFVRDARYDANGWTAAGYADVIADPMWTDPARGNFAPLPGSPCISEHAGAPLQ